MSAASLSLTKQPGGSSVVMLIRSYRFIKPADVNFEIHGSVRKRLPCRFTLRRDGVSNRFPLSQTQTDHQRPQLYLTSRFRRTFEVNSKRFRRFYYAQKSHLRSKLTYIGHWSPYSNREVILVVLVPINSSSLFLVFGLADFTFQCDTDTFLLLLHLFRKH